MTYNFTQWGNSHKEAAKKILEEDSKMDSLPKEIMDWLNVRPIVEGVKRDFRATPFWLDIYNDMGHDVMVVAGRQVFKSTYCTDMLGFGATSQRSKQVCYVTHDTESLTAFSNQRLRVGTFEDNPILAQFPTHGTGNVGQIQLKNKSVIFMKTDARQYKHVEGLSLAWCVLDEAQYHDIEFLPKLEKTFTMTKGRLRTLGIGGEQGSPYERKWLATDQREWLFDDGYDWKGFPNSSWRKKLEFNSEGLIVDDYIIDVVKGKWEAQHPEHDEFHGYHIPQYLVPQIPLTIEDAKLKYKTPVKFSIEYQKNNEPQSIYQTHVLGEFHQAMRRPITPEMVYACMNPYKHLHMMEPEEVISLKSEYGDELVVTMGIDWGSGPSASLTAVCVLLFWRKFNIYQIAYIEGRPREDQRDQPKYMIDLFNRYQCDLGIADLGYGNEKVKSMQEGGYDSHTGESYAGLGNEKLLGCHTISNVSKPYQFYDETEDVHGDKVSEIKLDKTTVMQEFIDMIKNRVKHPPNGSVPEETRPQLIIPFADESRVLGHPIDLVKDFTYITRKDLAEVEDIAKVDPRQHPHKEFNHPKDTVMAIIYAKQASNRFEESKWIYISA